MKFVVCLAPLIAFTAAHAQDDAGPGADAAPVDSAPAESPDAGPEPVPAEPPAAEPPAPVAPPEPTPLPEPAAEVAPAQESGGASAAHEVRFEFSGFGDINAGVQLGDIANRADLESFEAFGVGLTPVNEHSWFGLAGSDFLVLAHLTDRLTYLGEINFQVGRDQQSVFDVDVERMMLDYHGYEWLNAQLGLFFTPIGFQNRTHYARAWMMYSARIHDFFEEENGFVPTHTVGLHLYGSLPMLLDSKVNYSASWGNGRGATPDASVYARKSYFPAEVTARLELELPLFKDFRFGVSGWTDVIRTVQNEKLGASVDPREAPEVALWDTGFNPYVTLYSEHFNLLLEGVIARQLDLSGLLREDAYFFYAFSGELSGNMFEDTIHPYVRYDFTSLPADGGPYWSQRDAGGVFVHHYVPAFNAGIVGVAWDFAVTTRLKLEYIHHFDGPRRDTVLFQTAFAF